MMNLKDMTAKEAVRAAKEASGLTVEEIAGALGVKTSVIKRYLKKNDPYTPGLEMLPRLCVVLGNTLLLDWAAARLGQESAGRKEEMLLPLSKAIAVLEELRLLISKRESPSGWGEKETGATADEAELEHAGIRAFPSQRGGCDCGKKGFRCPLWKFWKKRFHHSRGRI